MIELLWSMLVGALLWAPAKLVGWLRRARLGRRGIVVWALEADASAEAIVPALELLDAMARDAAVRGLLLRLGPVPPAWASAQAIAEALLRLRAAGKLVVVYLEGGVSNPNLLVAAAADRVWMAPVGEVHLAGVGAELVFYGEALSRLGVVVEIEAAGAYKSFGETWSRAFPSRENRAAMLSMVADLQDQLLAALEKGRRLKPEVALALMARAPLDASEALEAGLVDGLFYADQIEGQLARLLEGRPRLRRLRAYGRGLRLERWLGRVGQGHPMVVVVHLVGPISNPGEGAGARIDPKRVVPALEALREDPGVAAVVLYIQSPGGSAVASDLIARAVQRLGAVRPVVAVMGDVAASGGYYIAAPAAEIVARPATITGSIGVVGGKLALGVALGRFGVHTERVEAGPNGGLFSIWSGFTDGQRERFRASLHRTYLRFLRVVGAGRRMPVSAVEPVAQGRVWTGRQALDHGLVDHLGGLPLGIARAEELAGVRGSTRAHLVFAPPRLSALRRFLPHLSGSAPRERLEGLVLPSSLRLPAALRLLAANPSAPLLVLPWTVDGLEP